MNIPKGKGLYVWNAKKCAQGNPTMFVEMAKELHLGHLSLKVQDGVAHYTKNDQQALLAEIIPGLREAGISVWGWGYLYGNRWFARDGAVREAAITLEAIERWQLDGFHIDAEFEYKKQNDAANTYINAVIAGRPGVSLGLSSYRFPSLHPELPWREFLRACSHHYPQVYWEGSHNPGAQLRRSVQELQAIRQLPVVPAGSAYPRGDWSPYLSDLVEFDKTARELGLPGLSYWSWEHAEAVPAWWTEIEDQDWPVPGAPEPPVSVETLTLEQRVEHLEAAVFPAHGAG